MVVFVFDVNGLGTEPDNLRHVIGWARNQWLPRRQTRISASSGADSSGGRFQNVLDNRRRQEADGGALNDLMPAVCADDGCLLDYRRQQAGGGALNDLV